MEEEFDEVELQTFKTAFAKNSSKREICQIDKVNNALKMLGFNIDDDAFVKLINTCDVNANHGINFTEFVKMLRCLYEEFNIKVYKQDCFKVFNPDKNGLISTERVNNALRRIAADKNLDETIVDEILMFLKTENVPESKITFEAFSKLISNNSECYNLDYIAQFNEHTFEEDSDEEYEINEKERMEKERVKKNQISPMVQPNSQEILQMNQDNNLCGDRNMANRMMYDNAMLNDNGIYLVSYRSSKI